MPFKEFRSFVTCAWIGAALTSACGSESVERNISQEPQRAGSPLETVAPRFIDHKPALSGDGTRLAFVSGRTSGDKAAVSKVFKAEWPAGGSPAEPVRATGDDSFGDEKELALSRDGKWLAIASLVNQRSDLILVSYDDATKVQRLSDDVAFESKISFSPDGKLVAWIASQPSFGGDEGATAGAAVAMLADVSGGADKAPPAAKLVSAKEAHVVDLFWVPVASGYALALGAPSAGSSGKKSFELLQFASFEQVASTSPSKWLQGLHTTATSVHAATATKVLLGSRPLAAENRRVSPAGDVKEPPIVSSIVSEPWVAKVASEETSGAPLDPALGYELLAADAAASGEVFVLVSRTGYRCSQIEGGSLKYGSTLSVLGSDLAVAGQLAPMTGEAAEEYKMVAGFCDRSAPAPAAPAGRIDDKIIDVKINAEATATNYRLAYVTRFSTAFDASCNLKMGDPEIMVDEFDGTSHRILPLSKNRMALSSDDRKEKAPCP